MHRLYEGIEHQRIWYQAYLHVGKLFISGPRIEQEKQIDGNEAFKESGICEQADQ